MQWYAVLFVILHENGMTIQKFLEYIKIGLLFWTNVVMLIKE